MENKEKEGENNFKTPLNNMNKTDSEVFLAPENEISTEGDNSQEKNEE